MRKQESIERFAPTSWSGLKVDAVKLETVGVLPYRLAPKARPIREQLWMHAKKEFSDLLSVQTPWGLVRPKFLPEGVGPASGLLQHIVRTIFEDFSE